MQTTAREETNKALSHYYITTILEKPGCFTRENCTVNNDMA